MHSALFPESSANPANVSDDETSGEESDMMDEDEVSINVQDCCFIGACSVMLLAMGDQYARNLLSVCHSCSSIQSVAMQEDTTPNVIVNSEMTPGWEDSTLA